MRFPGFQKEKQSFRRSQNRMLPEKQSLFLTAVLILSAGGTLLMSKLFYDAWIPGLILLPAVLFLAVRKTSAYLREKRRRQRKQEFFSASLLLRDYLRSGYSEGNAIRESLPELTRLYGISSCISEDYRKLISRMNLGQTFSEAFLLFGTESGVTEIRDFTVIFVHALSAGADLTGVIRKTTHLLRIQQEVEQEMARATAAAQFEKRAMCTLPVLILLYVRFSSPELLSGMYHGTFGRLFMTGILLLYLGCVSVSTRLLKVKV